eukprot:s6439_g2.t1
MNVGIIVNCSLLYAAADPIHIVGTPPAGRVSLPGPFTVAVDVDGVHVWGPVVVYSRDRNLKGSDFLATAITAITAISSERVRCVLRRHQMHLLHHHDHRVKWFHGAYWSLTIEARARAQEESRMDNNGQHEKAHDGKKRKFDTAQLSTHLMALLCPTRSVSSMVKDPAQKRLAQQADDFFFGDMCSQS